jgi:hypothetical protein
MPRGIVLSVQVHILSHGFFNMEIDLIYKRTKNTQSTTLNAHSPQAKLLQGADTNSIGLKLPLVFDVQDQARAGLNGSHQGKWSDTGDRVPMSQ